MTVRRTMPARLAAAMTVAGLSLTGCSSPGNSTPAVTPPTTPATSCLTDVAAYPDAAADAARTADIAATVRSLGGSERDWSYQWSPPTADAATTADTPGKVIAYLMGTMKALGWTNTRHRPGKNWGFERWTKAGTDAQVLVGLNVGRTVIVRGCRTT